MANEYFDFLEQNAPSEGESNHDVPKNDLVNLTLRADAECQVQCDGDFLVLLNANQITQVKAPVGQHILQFISTIDSTICVEKIVDFPEANKNYLVLVSELKQLIADEESNHLKESEQYPYIFTAKLGSTGKYTGDFKDGKPDGKGSVSFDSGGYYEGDFKNGWRHGKGLYRYPGGGRTYEGDFFEDLRTGFGKLTDRDGRTWEGEFLNGECNGKIKLTFANGDTLEGTWSNGKVANMPCVYTFFDTGIRRESSGYNDGLDGDGVIVHKDGLREHVTFKKSEVLYTRNSLFNIRGDYFVGLYKGNLVNGIASGEGVLTLNDKNLIGGFSSVEGWFKNGKVDGDAMIHFENGDVFKGKFKNGIIQDAPNTYTWANGDSFECNSYRNRTPHGKGTFKYRDGRKEERWCRMKESCLGAWCTCTFSRSSDGPLGVFLRNVQCVDERFLVLEFH